MLFDELEASIAKTPICVHMDGLFAFIEARIAENAFFFHKRIFIKASGKDASAEINYVLWTYKQQETHFRFIS